MSQVFGFKPAEIAGYNAERMQVLRHGDAQALNKLTALMREEQLDEQQKADLWRLVRGRYMQTDGSGEGEFSKADIRRLMKTIKKFTWEHEDDE